MRGRQKWFFLALAGLGALGVFWRIAGPYGGHLSSSDEPGYQALASNLAAGRGFTEYHQTFRPPYETERTAARAPLYPLFLSLFFHVADVDAALARARAAQAVLGGLAVFLLGLLAWQAHGDAWAALLAAALLSRDALSLDVSKLTVTEPLFLVWLLLALAALQAARQRQGPVFYGLGGACLGLALLTRPVLYPLFLFIVAALVWRAWRLRHRGREWISLAVFTLATLAVIAPWVVRNTAVNGRFTLLTTNSGFNLYVDNAPPSHQIAFTELNDLCRGPLRNLTETERDGYYLRETVRFIAGQPVRFLARIGQRFFRMWTEPPALSLLALAALALLLWLKPRENILIALLLSNFAIIYSLTFYDMRLAVTLDPFKFLYFAFALVWLARLGVARLRDLAAGRNQESMP